MIHKLNTDMLRLNDILKAISDIEEFKARGSFDDRMIVMAITYEIAIIGEAASKLSELFRSGHDYIPWSDIIGMRHRIIHDYGSVSITRLKEVVEHHLPLFKERINVIIQGEKYDRT